MIDRILASLCVSEQDAISGVGEIHRLMADGVMPEMSGMDLAGEISKSRPTIRPSFMSGNTETILREKKED